MQNQMVLLGVQLLEQVAAACLQAPPSRRRPAAKGASARGGSASPVDDDVAARLTDTAKCDVPAERLQRLWAAAEPKGAAAAAEAARDTGSRMAVYAVLQLLPAVVHSGLAGALSKAHKDFTVGLSRVFLAVALRALEVVQRTARQRAAGAVPAGASARGRTVEEIFAHAAVDSWMLLLVDQAGVYQWLAAALGVSTAQCWPEGHAAALDVVEVLTLVVPAEELAMWVRLWSGGAEAQPPPGAPASPHAPVIQLGEAWLAQHGRGKLVAALKDKGCYVPAEAGGRASGPARDDGAGVASLRLDVVMKHRLPALPPLVCPIDAVRGLDVEHNFRPCSHPGCTRVPASPGIVPEVASELPTMRCGRCRVESYCGAECQRAHWRAGHKEECPRLAQMRTDLESASVMMHFGFLRV